MIWFRFLLVGPIAAAVLGLFALYYWGRRNGMDRRPMEWLWALIAGLPMAIGNIGFNLIFGTWIFWELPPWKNTDGEFSPFFTTRIKSKRGDPVAEAFVAMVNRFDPGHFDALPG